jgi:N-acetylglucosaminyl-diphospho-decaprenol L-rhamnosyltransferase
MIGATPRMKSLTLSGDMGARLESADVATPVCDLDVIIIAHDSGELLVRCIASACEQVPADRVVVLDAESRDGAVERALVAHPGITTRRVPNDGFAASNNIGLSMTSGRYALLLNPDAELLPGAVLAMVACAEAHPSAGIVGAKVLSPDGSLQANQSGRFPSLPQVVGLRLWRLWQRTRGNPELSPRDFDEPREVDWVTGACMLARREAIDAVGPMDAAYFLYYEDTEWCHRMRDHGWNVVVEPAAGVVHHLGGSGGRSEAGERAYRESFVRYCDQHGLWGLRTAARLGLSVRRLMGGRA